MTDILEIEINEDGSLALKVHGPRKTNTFNLSVQMGILTIESETGHLIVLPAGDGDCIGLDTYAKDADPTQH